MRHESTVGLTHTDSEKGLRVGQPQASQIELPIGKFLTLRHENQINIKKMYFITQR